MRLPWVEEPELCIRMGQVHYRILANPRFTDFGFQVFYFGAKKVFHKDRRIRGGTIGGRSLFRIFICMPL
jgi:hypothetical protein